MKIVRVLVQNYRAIDRLELNFLDGFGSPRQVTVLAGPNGSGKSSILFAMTNALRGVMGYRTDDVPAPCRDDIRTPLSSQAGWSERPRTAYVEVEIEFDAEEQSDIPEVLKILGREEPPPLDHGRLVVHWQYPPGFQEDGRRRPWWFADVEPARPFVRSWLSAMAWAIQAWNRRTPGMRYEFLQRIGGLRFFPQDRNLRQRVFGAEQGSSSSSAYPTDNDNRAEDAAEDFLSRSPERSERSVSEILHYFSDYARGRVPPLPDEQNFERQVKILFERVCAPKRYLGYQYREDYPLGAPVFQDGDYQYPLSQAASGEQVILEYIARMIHPTPLSKGVILIDEPEIHLHPAWVRQLYVALPQIGARNQFILTTHSAELRNRAGADNALVDLADLGDAQ
jgi:hypothetical protein